MSDTDGFDGRNIELGTLEVAPSDGFIDVSFAIRPTEPGYEYSKLYYALSPDQPYHEDRVICFRQQYVGPVETHRLVLPPEARVTGQMRLRLDPLPYSRGQAELGAPPRGIDAADRAAPSLRALRLDLKQKVRAGVEDSERMQRATLPHLPESISLELTAGCNLTCSHCSSHGVAAAHAENNRRPAFGLDMLDRLAADAFPSLSLVNLVGRGEPMMVGQPLWQRLVRHLREQDVLLTCVTNGTFLKKRLDDEVLPVVDTITASIDGTTAETFAANRGGASLDDWRRNIDYYNALRDRSGLARRPRLGLSWTLKRNNISQFPDFIRLAIEMGADLLYVRHLFVFHEKDRGESLIGEPELANRWLKEGYALLEGRRIKLDAVPLAEVPEATPRRARRDHRPIVFPHVPKTAGQRVYHEIGTLVGAEATSPIRDFPQAEPGQTHLPPGYRFYGGHIDWVDLDGLADPFAFTILRHPGERLASLYFFLQREALALPPEVLAQDRFAGQRRTLDRSPDAYFLGGDPGWQRFIRNVYDNFCCTYLATRRYWGSAEMDGLGPAERVRRALAGAARLDAIYGMSELDRLERDMRDLLGAPIRVVGNYMNVADISAGESRWTRLLDRFETDAARRQMERFVDADLELMEALGVAAG